MKDDFMSTSRITVIISQGQSRNPEKRDLESSVAEQAAAMPDIDVLLVPHLYDATRDGPTFRQLRQIEGPIIAVSWLYERALHWVLDRNGVRGQIGQVQLLVPEDSEETDEDESTSTEEITGRVIDDQPRPRRNIYCIEFRASEKASDFIAEFARIAADEKDNQDQATWLRGSTSLAAMDRFEAPTNTTYVGSNNAADGGLTSSLMGAKSLFTIDEHPTRRWYPVIDFSRCTNCMECIDFCLFGVYGVDAVETIVVEQPDNCRKGCPACSRVCPQNAIIFPQHNTPAIAGAPIEVGGLKIDLSKLFGAPDGDEDAVAVAARERDEQLILAGREAVGISQGIRDRLGTSGHTKRDELDSLIDQLDELDL